MQERHYLASPASPSSSRWLVAVVTTVGAAALTLLSTGCPQPADLENPEQYPARDGTAGTAAGGTAAGGTAAGGTAAGGSATGGTGGGSSASCEAGCMATVLQMCTVCHGANLKSAMLDLEAPGYTARLKDVPATHAGIAGTPTCPTGAKLIDTANPADSWLLKKVSSKEGDCGDPMPQGSGLSGDDLKCVEDYVNCVAGGM